MKSPVLTVFAAVLAFAVGSALAAEKPFTLDLWPGTAPGEKGNIGEEKDTTKPGGRVFAWVMYFSFRRRPATAGGG